MTPLAPADSIDSPDEVFRLFTSRTNLERTAPQLRLYRLERMVELMRRLEQPELSLPVVHIAGSKGKGSTAAFTASLLAATGQRVGLYMSPHVTDYRERFQVIEPGTAVGTEADRHPGRERALTEAGRHIWREVTRQAADGVPEDELPTTFELMTALAFCYFPRAGCTWVVLETGLGGRLDATNVCRPAVTMITRIELEHTDYLGPTLSHIAAEKAGIIKSGAPLLLAPQSSEPDGVFRRIAAERGVTIHDVAPLPAPAYPEVLLPEWTSLPSCRLAMLGKVHASNAAMGVACLGFLAHQGALPPVGPAQVRRALEGTRLPGRGEICGDLVLDGAHTPESSAALAEAIRERWGPALQLTVILGVVAGKDIEGITASLAPITREFIVSRPGTFKPGDPEEVCRRAQAAGHNARLLTNPDDALAAARRSADGGPILVTGSFYMVAEIRRRVLP